MSNKPQDMNYMHYQEYFKNFLGSWTFAGGDKTLTIRRVQEAEMYDAENGGKKTEPVVYFEELDLPMVLNLTNAEMIARVTGTDVMGEWVGKKIVVGTSKVKAFGQVHDAIRVRDQAPTEEVYTCERCGQVIKEGKKLVLQTRADFGQALCIDCARKAKAEQNG